MRNSNGEDRGSALLMVLVIMVLLGVAGAALLVNSSHSFTAAQQSETSVGLESCAMAVRQHLSAKVAEGLDVTTLSFTVPSTGTSITIQGGHYDDAGITSFALTADPAGTGAGVGGVSVENLSNALPMLLSSGSTTSVGSAVCTDSNGRTYEVEFSFVSG